MAKIIKCPWCCQTSESAEAMYIHKERCLFNPKNKETNGYNALSLMRHNLVNFSNYDNNS